MKSLESNASVAICLSVPASVCHMTSASPLAELCQTGINRR
jgi:hypothetical protein